MLSQKDRDLIKPSLLQAKQAALKQNPKLAGFELVDAITDMNLTNYGLEHHVHLYFVAHLYARGTHKWLMKLLAGEEIEED